MTEANKITKEVAEQELERFFDAMGIEADDEVLDDEERQNLALVKHKVIKAICRGYLIINDKGEAVYTTQRDDEQKTIHFHEPTGANIMAQDRIKKGHDVGKMYAVMGEVTREHPKVFANLKKADLEICNSIITLLMG